MAMGIVNVPGVDGQDLELVRQAAATAQSTAEAAARAAAAAQKTADEAKEEAEHGGGGGSGIELADVTNVAVVSDNGKVSLNWTDPDDIVYNGATLARWTGTLLVRKEGSAPTSKTDGVTVIDSTTKNAYATTAYEDSGLTNGTTYYYRFFPHTAAGTYTAGTSVSSTPNMYDPNLTVSADEVTVYSGASSGTKTVTVTSDSGGAISVESSDDTVATATISGNTVTITFVAVGTATVTVSQAAQGDYKSETTTIAVTAAYGIRYGYRIKKSEGNPAARVEYLFDAVGKTPAQMNFSTGVFSYGDWADDWFVTENKPLMLKNDGTVDYYLNPNDYTKKESGGNSDVANTSYAGNAMAQFPLCWVKRYEEDGYEYEIISNVQYDSDYKAYAHTRADGSIGDFFYWSCFGGSKDSNGKMRSLSGLALTQSLTAQAEIDACKLNGAKWYTHTWSQRELIRTLCVLMGKSTDTQAVFGNGNCCSGSASNMLTTGTLKDKGQFYGYNSNNQQVKVFHIEKFWGDQWDRTAGIINNSGKIYAKMTPEGQGYRVTDVTGYTDTGVSAPAGSGAYISAMKCSEYGMIPTAVSGSTTTYYPDGYWANNGQLDYLISGACAAYAAAIGGAFTFAVNSAPSHAHWNIGCGLSCEQPAAA